MIWFWLFVPTLFVFAALDSWTDPSRERPHKQSLFTDIQIKPIKGAPGWSSISFKINDRQYRLDMEDEFAKDLEKRLQ